MSVDVVYLRLEDLLALASASGPAEVRDYGLLESALARPAATVFGDDAYETLPLKAAALAQSIVVNHALIDGNKRLGLLALLLFLNLNGFELDLGQRERANLILAIADGTLRDVEDLAPRLQAHLVALS